MDMDARKAWVVGTDIGGTFTDVICVNLVTGEQRLGKVASTPPTFFDGVINGLERAGIRGEEVLSFRHGATVSTNAILERKGVKTALVTTEGFRDVLGGGRDEWLSLEAARKYYGVVIKVKDAEALDHRIDWAATKKLRAQLKKKKFPEGTGAHQVHPLGKKIRVAWVPTVEEVQPHITISRPPGW